MTPEQVIDVLTKLAAYDQRTVGDADVLAWHEVIGRYELADCLQAVTLHYREQSTRAMPADIRRLAAGIRDAREARERQKTQQAIEAGPTTRDRSDEVTALVHAVADALPKPDVHARALARAHRERGHQPPQRKERKKAKKPGDFPPPQSDDVAALATRYLVDGYAPVDVANRLNVSRRWCEKTARRVRPNAEEVS